MSKKSHRHSRRERHRKLDEPAAPTVVNPTTPSSKDEPALPSDPAVLHQMIRELLDQLRDSRRSEEQLRRAIEDLVRRLYGPKAEKVDPNQLRLFAADELARFEAAPTDPEPAAEPTADEEKVRTRFGRKPLAKNLPRRRVVHEIPEAERLCPCCNVVMQPIREEVSEQLDYRPASLEVVENVRVVYGCPKKCDESVPVAPKPAQPIEKGIPGPGLLAYVVGSKYGEHLPLYRLEDILARQGALIGRSTLCGWMAAASDLSSGEVSALCRRFLVYLEALHQARSADLRIALEQDGGWPLHIDATGEDGQGTLMVAYAGWRRWALGAWKVPTERADAILPKMRAVAATFGVPCAVMRDLGRAAIEAARDFAAELDGAIPVLGCHLHFVKDIGKDLLCASHDNLRDLFRRFRVRPRLRALARDLGRSLSTDIVEARDGVTQWLAGTDERFLLPEGNVGLAVVRALTQWVLDYADDGTDTGFPFDRPYLDLYRRCHRACRAAESLLRKPHSNPRAYQAIERLHRVVVPVRSEVPFEGSARILHARARLFDELRDALRLQVKPPATQPAGVADPRLQAVELRNVKEAVEALQASLRERRPERGPAQDTRQAIDLILRHLERHGSSLWGHVIALPPEVGGGIRLVARTNVLLESFFHTIKHGERRRSGRKVLSQDFQHLPAAAALARNLVQADYVEILCGSLENLPHAFAQLDAPARSLSLPARLRTTAGSDGIADIVSSSLPKPDRILVRTLAMHARVMAESRSRAPRRCVARVN